MANNVKMNWTAGQAIAPVDMNAIDDVIRSFIMDQMFGGQARINFTDTTPLQTVCYCPTSAHGFPTAGGTLQVTNTAGYVFQMVGAVNGSTPQLLGFNLAAGQLLTTLAVGSGTQRIDGIFIKITDNVVGNPVTRDFQDASTGALSSQTVNNQRTTTLTSIVVQGTPAAPPTKPATPAGYVPWAYVWVPASYNAAFTPVHISDVRFPMSYGVVDVQAKNMISSTPASTPLSTNGQYFDLTGSTPQGIAVMAPFPGGADCRLIRVEIHGSFLDPSGTSDATMSFGMTRMDMSAIPIAGGIAIDPVGGGNDTNQHGFSPAAAVKVLAIDLTAGNTAVWGNGYQAGAMAAANSVDPAQKAGCLSVYSQTTGSGENNKLCFVRFFYAH